jgi:hypothetical protein
MMHRRTSSALGAWRRIELQTMTTSRSALWFLTLAILVVLAACDKADSRVASPASHARVRWCDELPRPANAALERVAD